MNKLDFKKQNPDLYSPGEAPSVIDVPVMNFIMVNGQGNPNTPEGEYHMAVELLYALSYTIKMGLKKANTAAEEYSDYTVAPLEGLWWLKAAGDMDFSKKDKYQWCSMIRQPDFITEAILLAAKVEVRRKKPGLEVTKARFETFHEGLCVQAMHIGPYDDEDATIKRINTYIRENSFQNDIGRTAPDGTTRKHHEIYLSDPRKTDPSKMKTIIRHPVK